MPAASGCTFLWELGDGSPDLVTATPTATHDYAEPGVYAVGVVAVCGGGCVRLTTLTITVPSCCPRVTALSATVDCAPAGERGAEVTFVATTDPPAALGTFTWQFGDGVTDVTAAPVAAHVYTSAGTLTVRVTFTPDAEGCPPTMATTSIELSRDCVGDRAPDRDSGESKGCMVARWAIVLMLGLAQFFLWLAVCLGLSSAATMAAGFAAAATLLLLLWVLLCGSWCGLLLILWQSALVGGWVALYLGGCCGWLEPVGYGLLAVGAGFFATWEWACDPGRCVSLRELAFAFGVALATSLDVIAGFAPCGKVWVALAVALLAATFTSLALMCIPDGAGSMARRLPGARARRRTTRRAPCGGCR